MDFTSNRFSRRSPPPRFDGSVYEAPVLGLPYPWASPTRSQGSTHPVGALGHPGPRACGLVAFI
jgi:hypothetical protein